MSRPPRFARFLVIALFLGLFPLKTGGCDGGRTACFTVSGKTCPSEDSLNQSISMSIANTMCSGEISSVDGPGTLDGDLCCYPVSYAGNGAFPCSLGISTTTVGTGGFGTTTFPSSSSGFAGGTTTSSNCVSCNAALQGAPFSQVCNPTPLDNLRICACASTCTTECDPTLCEGNAPDTGCLSCLQANCSSQLTTCKAQ
jgi:hypothetical protein